MVMPLQPAAAERVGLERTICHPLVTVARHSSWPWAGRSTDIRIECSAVCVYLMSQLPRLATGRVDVTNGYSHRMSRCHGYGDPARGQAR